MKRDGEDDNRLASVVSLTAILDVDRFAKFATGFDQLVTDASGLSIQTCFSFIVSKSLAQFAQQDEKKA